MRMDLMNVQPDNAKLEDSAILLLSHKSDMKCDNDVDLQPFLVLSTQAHVIIR